MDIEELKNAIQEFEDSAFHSSFKSKISDKAKSIALKCMKDRMGEECMSLLTGMQNNTL